jgi:hypothetical protein
VAAGGTLDPYGITGAEVFDPSRVQGLADELFACDLCQESAYQRDNAYHSPEPICMTLTDTPLTSAGRCFSRGPLGIASRPSNLLNPLAERTDAVIPLTKVAR